MLPVMYLLKRIFVSLGLGSNDINSKEVLEYKSAMAILKTMI